MRFRYDVTQAGVDAWAVGAGSSSAGLEDFIGFHASTAPSGYEIGYYGIEGNGVDNHSIGKPSDGVHRAKGQVQQEADADDHRDAQQRDDAPGFRRALELAAVFHPVAGHFAHERVHHFLAFVHHRGHIAARPRCT